MIVIVPDLLNDLDPNNDIDNDGVCGDVDDNNCSDTDGDTCEFRHISK